MKNTLKIVIPTAGWASRMRPQTWSKPKPLVSVGGKPAMDHLLKSFHSIPKGTDVEYVIIVGKGLGEEQIPIYMKEHYPSYKVHFTLQEVMRGQSDALYLARQYLKGPLIVCFSDTLTDADFSILAQEKTRGIAWVKPVPDPRRFGVAELDGDGFVTRLIEKPTSMENNLVVVGCYYIPEGEELISAISEQMRRGATVKNEFFLTDAINIMLERGLKMRTITVVTWLDTGTIAATLETNRWFLDHGGQTQNPAGTGTKFIPPVFVHASAQISDSTIGPHASIGEGCQIKNSRIEDSILEKEAVIENVSLTGSFIGRRARVQAKSKRPDLMVLNVGDDSTINLE